MGYRKWIAIAVFAETEWQAFKAAMGHPAWAEDEKFASFEARKQNETELNQNIEPGPLASMPTI
nr:CoA transferase [Desulfosarcina cetonica]